MYYSLFGRCRSPRSRTCNCNLRPCNQQNTYPGSCNQQNSSPGSYNQQNAPSESYNQQNAPSESYNQQNAPSESCNQQNTPSRSYNQQNTPSESCNPKNLSPGTCQAHCTRRCSHDDTFLCRQGDLFIRYAAFGGLVLPEGTEKRATCHVASLNLDTSHYRDFLVQLDFSCNIIAESLVIRLRFRLLKQERSQCFSVPVCAGLLYQKDDTYSEANSITLSACDLDGTISTCCCYNVIVEIEEFEAGGSAIIANPVLIATIVNRN